MEEKVVDINEIGMEEIRNHTLKRFSTLGINIPVDLPFPDRARLCAIDELAQRMVILYGLKAMVVHPEDEEPIKRFLSRNYAGGMTLLEQKCVGKKHLSKQDERRFSWYSEALYTLLWATQIIGSDKLEYPPQEIEVPKQYLDLLPPEKSYADFKSLLKLRDHKSLLRELDFYYLLHWYAKKEDRERRGFLGMLRKKSTSLNLSVVTERRKALEWVLDADLDWDHVPLDT